MFFKLKRGIIQRGLEKRNKEKPFDFDYAENFSLEGVTDPLINNSYYFSAHSEGLSFYARLGKRVNMDETWFALFLGGKMYSLPAEIYPAGESPIKVSRDGKNWTISYKGILNEKDEVDFSGTFIPKHHPIDFTSNMPAVRMATGIANEKWSKDLFTELQNISGQCHYEQEGILKGEFTLNGAKTPFELPCVRDHSFGKRDWNYMNNHLWLMAVAPSCQFNYSLVSYPVISALEVGNYRDASGMHYMMQANLDLNEVGKGEVPSELSFNVILDSGRTIPVKAARLDGVTYHFQDGQYILIENIAEFTIDGKTCRGILEIGFNHDNSRFFNKRNLGEIVR